MEKQPRRFSDDEISLIKGTFKDNLDLLKAIRKSVLQMELTEKEDVALRTMLKKDVMKVVKKCFLPEIDGDAPIMQTVDLWATLNFSTLNPDLALLHIKSRKRLIEYIGQRMQSLEGIISENIISFKEMSSLKGTPEDIYIDLFARNTIVMHTEQQINQLNVLANEKEETEEDIKERLKKDSSK